MANMKLSGSGCRVNLTVNGKRCGVYISAGPWISGEDKVKITPKKYSFPKEVAQAFAVENNSDSQTDYFEKDQITLRPGHPLFEQAKSIYANN